MATILLVEDALDVGVYDAALLEDAGHVVIRCRAAFGPFGACALVRDGTCRLADQADLIVFSHGMYSPVDGRTRGDELLRAYRGHPSYGSLPCLVVTIGHVGPLEGAGKVLVMPKYSDPRRVSAAVEHLLGSARAVRARSDDRAQ